MGEAHQEVEVLDIILTSAMPQGRMLSGARE